MHLHAGRLVECLSYVQNLASALRLVRRVTAAEHLDELSLFVLDDINLPPLASFKLMEAITMGLVLGHSSTDDGRRTGRAVDLILNRSVLMLLMVSCL